MAEILLTSVPHPVRGQAEVLRSKVEEERLDFDKKVERIIDLDHGKTTTWFYWSPSPGVRCYTYGEATKPVEQIRLPNI